MNLENLKELQWKLEEGMVSASRAKFVDSLESLAFTENSLGTPLFTRASLLAIAGTTSWLATYKPKSRAIGLVLGLPAKELAIISTKFTMDRIFGALVGAGKQLKVNNSISSLSIALGRRLVQQFNFSLYYRNNPGLFSYLKDYLKDKSRSYRHRTMTWWRQLNAGDTHIVQLTPQELSTLGYYMLKIVVETTGLFEVIPQYKRGKTLNVVSPTKGLIEGIMSNLSTIAEAHPVFLPMVIPPLPWTTHDDGGYLGLKVEILASPRKHNKFMFSIGGVQSRLKTLNYLQAIPWVVNGKMVAVLEEAYRCNHECVPLSDLSFNAPVRPWNTSEEYVRLWAEQPEVVKAYKKAYGVEYSKFFNSRSKGQRLAFLRILSIARRFQHYPAIYFPWKLDYRGRFYPIPSGLNPQADDIGKSLLQFKYRSPVTKDNLRWLLIHGAGLLGYDKVSFDARVHHMLNLRSEIETTAQNFRANTWWHEADKPWSLVAWCIEVDAIWNHGQTYCQTPIALDGTCNGLQHLSAASRDEATGTLVNLVPGGEVPADIYTAVAEVTESLLPNHSPFKGQVTRKLVKRNTMTTPYNVTLFGMKAQVEEELRASVDRQLNKQERDDAFELAQTNHRAIAQLLGSSIELMHWYSAVVNAYVKAGIPILWELPDGFKVLQRSPAYKSHNVELERKTVVVRFRSETVDVDAKKAQASFAPNVTHSLDATHMALVIENLRKNYGDNIPFAPIHDSFGVPLHLVDPIGENIKQTFVFLYETFDIIKWFQEDYKEKTGGLELPPPPPRGTLDISKIPQCPFCFS